MGEITYVYEGGEFEFVFWDGGADVWVSFCFLSLFFHAALGVGGGDLFGVEEWAYIGCNKKRGRRVMGSHRSSERT